MRTIPSSSWASWEDHLQKSSLFQYVQHHAIKPAWVVQNEDQDQVIVSVGDNNLPDRFDTWYWVKVNKSTGAVFQQTYDAEGEIVWVPADSNFSP